MSKESRKRKSKAFNRAYGEVRHEHIYHRETPFEDLPSHLRRLVIERMRELLKKG